MHPHHRAVLVPGQPEQLPASRPETVRNTSGRSGSATKTAGGLSGRIVGAPGPQLAVVPGEDVLEALPHQRPSSPRRPGGGRARLPRLDVGRVVLDRGGQQPVRQVETSAAVPEEPSTATPIAPGVPSPPRRP